MLDGYDPPGATPLGMHDLAGLRPSWITTRAELNEAEQTNILAGLSWAQRARKSNLLTESFIQSLHKAMFGKVWRWAGTYRSHETNIGVPSHRVQMAVREFLDTGRYWLEQRPFPDDEIAILIHHRLVQIHPFPNGNGRHTRAMADLVAEQLGRPRFSWSSGSLADAGPIRTSYIAALREADNQNIAPLLAFARS